MFKKLLSTPNDPIIHPRAPLTILAMTAEVFGGAGLFLGLFSRIAALGVLVVMIVAPLANHL